MMPRVRADWSDGIRSEHKLSRVPCIGEMIHVSRLIVKDDVESFEEASGRVDSVMHYEGAENVDAFLVVTRTA